MRKRIILSSFIIIIFLILTMILMGCGGKKESDYSRVEPASNIQTETIKSGILPETKTEIGEVHAVKSNDFENLYFCATRLSGPGMSEDAIGVWAITGEKDNPGMILSVNGIAKEFSVYPDGSRSQANITMDDDGAKLVENYISEQ